MAAPAAADPRFLPGTEDVPLMPALQVASDQDVVFDEPEGRIIDVSARGPVTRKDVAKFYADSLPQLGWKVAGPNRFERGGERLSLRFQGPDGKLLVGFTLSPL
jgi:hypothetical protein